MIQVHDLHQVTPDEVGAWTRHIAENLRQQDVDEVEASSGMHPKVALPVSLLLSTRAFAILDRDGVPVSMFGAAPHPLPGVGVAWLLGTDGLLREAYHIARQSSRYIDELHEEYPLLWNYVDERNTVSRRWLKWSGFKLYGEKPSTSGHRFHIFARSSYVLKDVSPMRRGAPSVQLADT